MPIATPGFGKWQAAEQAAQAVEGEIPKRLLEAPADAPPPDLDAELAPAGELRRIAHALFEDAMIELDNVASALERSALHGYSADMRRSIPPSRRS
jgi:hypothetical protein